MTIHSALQPAAQQSGVRAMISLDTGHGGPIEPRASSLQRVLAGSAGTLLGIAVGAAAGFMTYRSALDGQGPADMQRFAAGIAGIGIGLLIAGGAGTAGAYGGVALADRTWG